MSDYIASVRSWLEARFESSSVEDVKNGTYGIVFILKNDTSGHRFAAKLYDPGKTMPALAPTQATLFKREIGLWLHLPNHLNVMPIDKLEIATGLGEPWPSETPVVLMPFMEASLSSWIQQADTVPASDRQLALAHLCNGLAWCYANGIDGHGDLKPDNILIHDLRKSLKLDDNELMQQHPWQVRVADFGWANIWRDCTGPEYARKGWRPYLGPERLEGDFVRQASDIFAIGVIGTELLSGLHPAGDTVKRIDRRWDQKKYLQWANSGERKLDPTLVSAGIRDLLFSCLDPKPEVRPSAAECFERLCEFVERDSGFPLKFMLTALNNQAGLDSNTSSTAPWAAEQVGRLGVEQIPAQIDRLRTIVEKSPDERAAGECVKWIRSSLSLCRLLLKEPHSTENVSRASIAGTAVLEFVVRHFDSLDLRMAMYEVRPGELAIEDLEPQELMWGFAQDALAVIRKAGTSSDERVVRAQHFLSDRAQQQARKVAQEFAARSAARLRMWHSGSEADLPEDPQKDRN